MRGQRYVWNGTTWVPLEVATVATPGGHSNTPSCWPQKSLALSVHPKQVTEANARAKRHGISVHYDARGDCYIPDRANRKKLLRLEGLHDNRGGYGD